MFYLIEIKYYNFCHRFRNKYFKIDRMKDILLKDSNDIVLPDNICMKLIPNQKYKSTKSKLWFECNCGKSKEIALGSVLSGYTKSLGCSLGKAKIGKANKQLIFIDKSKWLDKLKSFDGPKLITKYEDLPDEWSENSIKIMDWLCNCGNVFQYGFGRIYDGHKKTCSKCNLVNLSSGTKYGNLELINDLFNVNSKTHKYEKFRCLCKWGNEEIVERPLKLVIGKDTSRCENCEQKKSKWMIGQVVNNKTILDSFSDKRNDGSKQISCLVECGICKSKYTTPISSLLRKGRNRKNCTNCYQVIKNRRELKGIEGIITDPNWFDDEMIVPLEDLNTKITKVKFLCRPCGRNFIANISDIRRSKVYSCGCINYSVSRQNIEIAQFIESFGLLPKYGPEEFHIGNNLKFDVSINNLVIEHNGLYWHSRRGNDKKCLMDKFYYAQNNGLNYLMIYEDEWIDNRLVFENIIKNELKIHKLNISIENIIIDISSNDDCKNFHNTYCHLGHKNYDINVSAKLDNSIICCISLDHENDDLVIKSISKSSEYNIDKIYLNMIDFIKNKFGNKIIYCKDNRIPCYQFLQEVDHIKIDEIEQNYYLTDSKNRYDKDHKNDKLKKIFDTGKTIYKLL